MLNLDLIYYNMILKFLNFPYLNIYFKYYKTSFYSKIKNHRFSVTAQDHEGKYTHLVDFSIMNFKKSITKIVLVFTYVLKGLKFITIKMKSKR